MLRQFTAQNKPAQMLFAQLDVAAQRTPSASKGQSTSVDVRSRNLQPRPVRKFQVKQGHDHHREPVTPEASLRAQAMAPHEIQNQIIPPNNSDEAILRYVRELAKRHAREDHEAEIAARQASIPATSERQ
ncbi:hypothetical protein JQ631_24030 [Bradyrhizobium manausense]|uniref:hypothetical protein n=1 Tax=Bradyrhizobium manausense TaxID=989370 RepID=UPI001BA7E09E|nr:hypothetical protein [Bradyrhizobium manausense]MBR0792165.1 hypothetical protein [Bradyrhizobium manausense]